MAIIARLFICIVLMLCGFLAPVQAGITSMASFADDRQTISEDSSAPIIQAFMVAYRSQVPPEAAEFDTLIVAAMEGQFGSTWRFFVVVPQGYPHSAAARQGRFPTMDAWWGDMKRPQSLHKYGYCNGGPVAFVDPMGNFGISIGDIMGTVNMINQVSNVSMSVTGIYQGVKALGDAAGIAAEANNLFFLMASAGYGMQDIQAAAQSYVLKAVAMMAVGAVVGMVSSRLPPWLQSKQMKEKVQDVLNGRDVFADSIGEADAILDQALPNAKKVPGSGPGHPDFEEWKGVDPNGKYHKDYLVDPSTGRIYGHGEGNPHGAGKHINIKLPSGDKVTIIIRRRK